MKNIVIDVQLPAEPCTILVTGSIATKHEHVYRSSGRCYCGQHREPARATNLDAIARAIFNDFIS